jgi:tetratricopeptide (TPR) repeat protein
MKWFRNDRFIVAALIGATLLVYGQTARFGFVHYDDPEYVFKNPHTLRGLNAAGARWALTTGELANWHPLTWLSYMADVTVFGYTADGAARPGPMHLVNVALHAGGAVALFAVLRAMTGARWRAGLVAALFALHPLHVESVAWISERKDVLSTLLGLLAMHAYVRYARDESSGAYALALAAFALSLLAKPMLVTLPLLLLVLDYWPLGRLTARGAASRLVVEKLPLLALSAASCAVTLLVQRAGGAMDAQRQVALPARLANAVVAYAQYLVDTFWPARLAMLYPMPDAHPPAIVAGSAAVLLAVTAGAVLWARRWPHLIVGWLWYLGTLVPVIGIVAVGEQSRADRYTYFPLIGVFVMIAWSLPAVRARGAAAISTGATAAVMLFALSVQAWRQVRVWRDSEALFTHAIAVVGPHPTLYLNRAIALSESEQHDRAVELYRQAIELRPDWAKAHNNLGNSLVRVERFAEAEQAYRRALQLEPRYALAYYNLGTLLARQDRLSEGEQMLREALRLQPNYPAARQNLNNTLVLQGKPTIGSVP